jgi:hypothetical protein
LSLRLFVSFTLAVAGLKEEAAGKQLELQDLCGEHTEGLDALASS